MAHPDSARIAARQLRAEGRSLSAIALAVGAARSTVSLWVRDIALPEPARAALEGSRPGVPASSRAAA